MRVALSTEHSTRVCKVKELHPLCLEAMSTKHQSELTLALGLE